MKKTKQRKSAVTAIMLRVTAIVMSLWLIAMAYLTVIVAKDLMSQWEDNNRRYNESSFYPGWDSEYENYARCRMIEQLHNFDESCHHVRTDLPLYEDPTYNLNYFLYPGSTSDVAMVMLNYEGEVIADMGDHITFYYITEEAWLSENSDSASEDYAWVDLGDVPGDYLPQLTDRYHGDPFLTSPDYFAFTRLTGYFENGEFHLVKLSTVSTEIVPSGYDTTLYGLAQLEQQGQLPWEVVFDQTADCNRELVNLYSNNVRYLSYTPSSRSEFRFNGKTYASMNELATEIVTDYRNYELLPENQESIWESFYIRIHYYLDSNDELCYYVSVTRCFPILSAMARLFWLYVITLQLPAAALLLLWRCLRRNLGRHTARIQKLYEHGEPVYIPEKPAWLEPYLLEVIYDSVDKQTTPLRQENTRLQTALDYAHEAEENRRVLVSNITHELKTPLAVIHSYTEGLLEGIAPEKQEQYLQIIQGETEKMDAMVLDMLDLSRLEAGKVRLASDTFSLLELTRRVFEKLSLSAEEKGLTVEYALTEEFPITTDEARMTQVVTNLASNAIKYTPEGGIIRIKHYRFHNKTWLTIENTSPHLPDEALDKIWDAFYRVESSRTTKGTGLGLSIVKAIVTLMGGSCNARNTDIGVEFTIVLP